jgi:hypothetical protein
MTTRRDPGIKRKHTYDPRCYDLAALFLGDEPKLHTGEHMDELAHLIQQCIEDYIAYMRDGTDRWGKYTPIVGS